MVGAQKLVMKINTSIKNKKILPRIVLGGSVLLAIAAWLIGYYSNGTDIIPLVPDVIPGASRVESRDDYYIGLDTEGNVIGYAAVGQSQGYAGPIVMLVGVNLDGAITGVQIVTQHETPGFFRLFETHDFVGQYFGLQYNNPLKLGQDIDAVSGATVSSEAIAQSTRQAIRVIARDGLASPLPPEKRTVKFGFPELTLIGLYAAGYFGHKHRSRIWKKRLRWGTLLTGMVVLGFIYTAPFTIAQVIALLSGYWPDWHNNLYWYILIGGILFVTTVDSKNPYCHWFCPFGAFQECLAQITGAKMYRPRGWSSFFTWLQRGLAFAAVLLGLALRQPGVAGYEPFATLFDLRGTSIEWILLALVTIASLLMYRPFCNYLCPLDPVYDFIAESRRWIREVRRKWQQRNSKA